MYFWKFCGILWITGNHRPCLVVNVYLLIIFQIHSESENDREANEMYDAIKEGGSTQILGHLMRVLASSYFFALL